MQDPCDITTEKGNVAKGSAVPLIEGGGSCLSTRKEDMKTFLSHLQNDDNKILHIIERFSLLENFVARASFGRIVADLLSFCNSERG